MVLVIRAGSIRHNIVLSTAFVRVFPRNIFLSSVNFNLSFVQIVHKCFQLHCCSKADCAVVAEVVTWVQAPCDEYLYCFATCLGVKELYSLICAALVERQVNRQNNLFNDRRRNLTSLSPKVLTTVWMIAKIFSSNCSRGRSGWIGLAFLCRQVTHLDLLLGLAFLSPKI